MVARELQVRYRTRPDLARFDRRERLDQPVRAAKLLAAILEHECVEVMVVLMLTVKYRPICFHEVGRGSLSTVIAEPREIFKAALLANAGCVVVAHNHPSGDPEPSPDDIAFTRRLSAAAHLIGVPVVDHIVIGAERRYYSFKEAGILL